MIELINISKNYGKQELFYNVNLRINSGDKIGLVGKNGSGKSTLFKLVLQEDTPDIGQVCIPKNYTIASLQQHLEFSQKNLIDECVLALKEEDKFSTYKVEKILFGLGFVEKDLNKDPLSFSGGFQIRINLAKLLLTEPNMLLLDEPTNYLDILSLRWLKSFLKNFEGEVILVTHDKKFMDTVCTHTMGIIRKELSIIIGNTDKFYAQIKSNDEHHMKQKISQDKKRKELEEFVAKNKARASTSAQAQSKVKILEKMTQINNIVFDNALNFNFNFKNTPAKVLLDVKNISFAYQNTDILFKDISFVIKKGETLGIIGKNGKGKSTLLNTLAANLKNTTGSIDFHTSTAFAHFGQTNIAHLNPNNTVMDEIYIGNPKLSESSVRSICGAMMFSNDDAKKKISLLSGGEKSRVMLGQIISRDVNLLFLDEPTNHLDMDSIEALTKAIKNFQGSCIIVTHSEELLSQVCDKLIVFASDDAFCFDGTYDEFLNKIGWEEEVVNKKIKKTVSINKKENKKLRTLLISERNIKTNPLKKEVIKYENLIMKIESLLEKDHKELIMVAENGDNSRLIELSSIILKYEAEIEINFTLLENSQNLLDTTTEEYDIKLAEL